MCGIAGGFNADMRPVLDALAHRGPDAQAFVDVAGNIQLAHTRLSIIDVDARSNQPMRRGATTVSFNGEIWNYELLRQDLAKAGRTFTTAGDTEVVAAALDEWGDEALAMFEGMFAVLWSKGGTLKAARDRFGEVPLHWSNDGKIAFASEIKALKAMGKRGEPMMVEPGTIVETDGMSTERRRYYGLKCSEERTDFEDSAGVLHDRLHNAVFQRMMSDVPVCCLLSGGIDSSAVLYFLKKHLPNIVAYTAVHDEDSKDLKAARIVANELEVQLIEVPVPAPTAEGLSRVVRMIEMDSKAQVEIGWACVHLARAMRSDGFKVTFSGEGADELFGSYGFVYHAVQEKGWARARRDLFLDQHRKNFPRCNKTFLSHGVECRLPFLHTNVVELVLSMSQDVVEHGGKPKAVFREAMKGLLPESILKRPKLAFQDGAGLKTAAAAAVSDPKRFYRKEFERFLDEK